jgi:hypothetical protein
MKFRTHPHLSDLLTLTQADLDAIAKGQKLSIGGLNIEFEHVPKPDVHCYARILLTDFNAPPRIDGLGHLHGCLDNIKFTFDGETGKLKSAEVL